MNRRRLLTLSMSSIVPPALYRGLVSAQEGEDLPATVEAQATKIAKLQATNEALRQEVETPTATEPAQQKDVTSAAEGTPINDGTLVVANSGFPFPPLPEGSKPSPINGDWELLYYEVAASAGQYTVRGEIRNASSNPLETPTLIVTAMGGTQVGIHPDIDEANPGERAPFQYAVYEDELTSALNQSTELEFSGACEFYRAVPEQAFSWEFQNVEIEYNVQRSAVRVAGAVVNTGDTSAERYEPMLFGFTADGQYVGGISPASGFPNTVFSGDRVEFEMDHGFDTYRSNEPFAGAGREAVFVLAMAKPVHVSMNCVG